MEEKRFSQHFVRALASFLWNFFIYFLFIVPFDLWRKAILRLSDQKEKGSLKITRITSLWPLLSFLKAYLLEFLFDAFIFISYPLGALGFLFVLITGEFKGEALSLAFGILAGAYYAPIGLSFMRDFMQLLLLPIRKFLSWATKPAQYMDFTITNK